MKATRRKMMKPEVVLKLEGKKFPITEHEIFESQCEFVSAYEKIKSEHPELAQLCDTLTERVKYAAKLLKKRITTSAPSEDSLAFLSEKKENEALNGDFPNGNAFDADFSVYFFSPYELSLIQCSLHKDIKVPYYNGYNDDALVERGFIAELDNDYTEAARCYSAVTGSNMVMEREFFCKRKMKEIGDREYEIATTLMGEGKWSLVKEHLLKASYNHNFDAMVDHALAIVYSQFGIAGEFKEALDLLRFASYHSNRRACYEIFELYESSADISEDEAMRMLAKAAELGHPKAIARLKKD